MIALMKSKAIVGSFFALAAACSSKNVPVEGGDDVKSEIRCSSCESPAIPKSDLPASEEAWKRKLTPEQFFILRQRGTERAYSGEYLHHNGDGTYCCAGCGLPLYDSKTKYDSCGWPSFWDALSGAVAARMDGTVEAICSRCESHLGHIFDDGPPPTGKRH